MQIQFAVSELKAEMGVALTDGHEPVAQRRPELHMQLVTFLAIGRHFDVRSPVERKRRSELTSKSVEAARATTVGLVVVLADQPGRAGAAVKTRDVVAAGQSHRAIFPAESGIAGALVVGDAIGARSVLTRFESLALVDLHVAVLAFVAWIAEANVLGDAVLALPVQAGVAGALVNVNFTIRTWTKW